MAWDKGSHVHFGLGRLTVGLILEVLRGPRRIAVIQRPGPKWAPLRGVSKIRIRNTQGFKRDAKIVYDDGGIDPHHVTREWLGGEGLLILFTPQIAKYRSLLENADTMSTALNKGQADRAAELRELRLERNIWLFPFENETRLSALDGSNISVGELIADRICGEEPKLQLVEGTAEVVGACERWKEIVVLAENGDVWQGVFGDDQDWLIIARKRDEYNLYHHRKWWLVNSVHAMLAIYGYEELHAIGIPPRGRKESREGWDSQLIPVVLRSLLPQESQLEPFIRTFIDAQIVRLVPLTPREVRERHKWMTDEDVFYGLRAYARGVVTRFRENIDYMGRIVNLENLEDVVRRHEQHFFGLLEWAACAGEGIARLKCREKPAWWDVMVTARDVVERALIAVGRYRTRDEGQE